MQARDTCAAKPTQLRVSPREIPRSRRVTVRLTAPLAPRPPPFPRGNRSPVGAAGAGSRRVTAAHAPPSGPPFPQSLPRLPTASRRVTSAAQVRSPPSFSGTSPAGRAPPRGKHRAPGSDASWPDARVASSGTRRHTSSAASRSSGADRTCRHIRCTAAALFVFPASPVVEPSRPGRQPVMADRSGQLPLVELMTAAKSHTGLCAQRLARPAPRGGLQPPCPCGVDRPARTAARPARRSSRRAGELSCWAGSLNRR